MFREGLRLSRRHRALLYSCVGVLFATGVLWLAFHYLWRGSGEFGDLPHPAESWMLELHGAAAMVFLMLLGSLVRGHMRLGWKTRRNRWSGGVLTGGSAVLVLTGWALYYVGNESARSWISVAHWSFGLAAPALFIAHILFGRAARSPASISGTPSTTVTSPLVAPTAFRPHSEARAQRAHAARRR